MTSKLTNKELIFEMNKRFVIPYIYTNEHFIKEYNNKWGARIMNHEIIEEVKDIFIQEPIQELEKNLILITQEFIHSNLYYCDSCEKEIVKTYCIKAGYSIMNCKTCNSLCCRDCINTVIEHRCLLCL